MIPAESIFGATYGGVPNPFVPHSHPWPTRYHGPLNHYVRAGGIYQPSVYSVPTPGSPFGASPDGLGAFEPSSSAGGMLLRACAGALLGAAAALGASSTPAPSAVIAAAAAAATVIFGPEGMTSSIIAIALVSAQRRIR